MRITTSGLVRIFALGFVTLSATARAQTKPPVKDSMPAKAPATAPAPAVPSTTGPLVYAAEIGPRYYPSLLLPIQVGKFEEYRDLHALDQTSGVLQQLFARYAPGDSFTVYQLSAHKLADRDQSLWLLAKRPGDWDAQLRWDRIPHIYSTSVRSPGDEFNPGFNTLPTPRPDSNAWRAAPYVGQLRNQWDPVKATLALTPNKFLDFKADFTHIGKHGELPRSISYSGSSGPQREYASPVDQQVNNAMVSQGFTSGERDSTSWLPFIQNYQLNASYAYSRFDNDIRSTMVDNPQLSVSSFTNGTNTARVSLEPTNFAQTASANGSILLPMRTRLMGSVTSSWARQNDTFFPQTSNDSLARDPNYALVSSYSRPSLEGKMTTSTFTLSGTTHPVDKLTVTARYRNWDQTNQTPPFSIQAMIVSDRTVTLSDSEKFEAHPFTKKNANVGATYLITPGLALSAGYGLEKWERDTAVRNIERTTEAMPKVAVDFNGSDYFGLHAAYQYGSRRGNTPYTESATEITGFRRFDEADRNRTRVSLVGTVTPVDQVTFGLTLEGGNDKYPNSQYGIYRDNSFTRGIDVDWTPTDRISATAGWLHEDVKDSANYRYRTGAVGSSTYDNPTYKWANTNKDQNTTWYATFNAILVPDKYELSGDWTIVDSHWHMFNANPQTPSNGTPTANLAAFAQDWPEVTQRLAPVNLAFRYHYSPNWALTLDFLAEDYDQNDFRTVAPIFTTNGLNASPVLPVAWGPGDLPGTIGQVAGSANGQYHFLANNYHSYRVNMLTLLISYHPGLMPFARPRSTF